MSATVASRVIRSSPYRDTTQTWTAIIELLTRGKAGAERDELLSVAGVASALIAERSPKDAAIVVICDGPRTRIYCSYDEDAIAGHDAREDALGYDPLSGNWTISLPCPADDLSWVQRALKTKSSRITARDATQPVNAATSDEKSFVKDQDLAIDTEAFLRS
ncbi:hypothetical protein [Steroidobacter agaridevorans]|uniref:hypothetical protein n=1 Tax=Steroidobacter agaridevorans TaxID=2695856 RepID=UPI001326CBE4|nr:hypothetical protein [Steroidobacter agaridevorans]GFE91048.1 hypothetical protein GCM10011488_60020 [Steroidobacter agaridevorans]